MIWITGIYTVLIQVLQFVVLGYFISFFYKKRVWKYISGIGLFAAMMVFFRTMYLCGMDLLGVPQGGYTLFMSVCMCAVVIWCYEVSWKQALLVLLVYIGTCAVSTALGAASASRIPYVSVGVLKEQTYSIDAMIIVSIMDMSINLVYVVLVLLYYMFYKGMRLTGKLVYGLILLYQLLVYGLYLRKCMEYHMILVPLSILLVCMTTLIDCMMIARAGTQLERQRTEEALNLIYEQRSQERQQYVELEEKKAKLMQAQKLFSEQVMQAQKEVDFYANKQQVAAWMEETDRRVRECKVMQYCRNPIVNSVVYIKAQKAAELGITMQVQIMLPEIVAIRAVDLCSIFCNLLDNALEACIKVPEREKRYVFLHVQVKAGYIIILEENAACEPIIRKAGRIVSSKSNPDMHGHGLLLLRELTEKYEGKIITETGEEKFAVKIMLQI